METVLVPAIVAALGLSLLSIEDIKRREIDEKHVAALLVATIISSLVSRSWDTRTVLPSKVYVVINIVLILGVSLAALMGTLGWGDVAALLVIFTASPLVVKPGSLLPSLMVVLFYYLGAMFIYVAVNALINIIRHRGELRKLPSWKLRLVYTLIGRPRRARDFIEKPGWWYPLSLCGRYRIRFDINLDPPDIAKEVRKALRKGCIERDDVIWSSYGIPAIPLLTAAYVSALLLGDRPILIFMLKIIGLRIVK